MTTSYGLLGGEKEEEEDKEEEEEEKRNRMEISCGFVWPVG